MAKVGRPVLPPERMLTFLRENVRPERGGDCLIWAGSRTSVTSGAYPRVRWNFQTYQARALLLKLAGRIVPKRPVTWDTCGNHLCMNEAHIRVGTRKQLIAVMKDRGSFDVGLGRNFAVAAGLASRSKMGIAKAPQVLKMRAAGMTTKQIGKEFGVTASAVGYALKRWADVGLTNEALWMRDAA